MAPKAMFSMRPARRKKRHHTTLRTGTSTSVRQATASGQRCKTPHATPVLKERSIHSGKPLIEPGLEALYGAWMGCWKSQDLVSWSSTSTTTRQGQNQRCQWHMPATSA